jgi:hypothetical protein
MLKVCSGQCDQCLFSESRIVPMKRVKDIIQECSRDQTHFMCHKESDVVCGGFYKQLGHVSQNIRIAERLGCVEFVAPPKKINMQKVMDEIADEMEEEYESR